MITDKVLIFYHYGYGINGGGPMGFVNQNIEDTVSNFYVYPNKLDVNRKYSLLKVFFNFVKSRQNPDWDIKKDLLIARIDNILYWSNMLKGAIRKFKEIKADEYKFIYFHDMYTLKACLHLIKNEQTVIFQPHSPERMSFETKYFSDKNIDIDWANQAETDVFSRANIIVLANEYTRTIYDDVIYPASKIEYIISGCKRPENLRYYPLESNKINLLYVGRRSEIKGFHLIIDAFKQAREVRKDINLLLIGNGDKIEDNGIYDIGFTNTPHNWINSVDYVISTNVQSYFDLAVIETLGVGTPILLTSSQGHKMFIDDHSSGIIDIGEATISNIKKVLLSDLLVKKKDNREAVDQNLSLFERKYSKDNYLLRLNEFCWKLVQ
jgi:glycosyltransferase involved in cell wall biosynthesis